jgi:hypothetical protein
VAVSFSAGWTDTHQYNRGLLLVRDKSIGVRPLSQTIRYNDRKPFTAKTIYRSMDNKV